MRRTPLLRALVLISLSLLPALRAGAQAAKSDDYSGEAWIVESLHRRARMENDGTGREESTGRFRIQNDAGLRQLGQLVEAYNSAIDSIEFKSVRVSRPDGSIREVSLGGVREVASPVSSAFPVYSD